MKKFSLVVLVCYTLCGYTQVGDGITKKNILFIITDQQNYFTMKAYGNEVIQTPALDALAEQSFVFKNAYITQPVCAPSRASILSGRYPHTHGVINNNRTLALDILTFPEMINDPAYSSAYIGKWHLGDEIFSQRGFDTWVSMEDGYEEEYSNHRDKDERSDYHHWLVEKGYKPDKVNQNRFSRKFAASLPIEHCKPSFLREKALQYLEQVDNQPFIMYVSYLEPHKPYTGPLDSLYHPTEITLPENFNDILDFNAPQRYRNKAASEKKQYGDTEQNFRDLISRYWGLVTQVDQSVGAILNKLESLGITENTIVVFTSDHGSMMGAHRLVSKDVMYEESVRVPFLLKAPSLTHQRRIINERVGQIDIVPTLLDLLGNTPPKFLQGKSLLPFLKREAPYRRDVFIEWPGIRTIVTQENWKMSLIENDKCILFDLNTDPFETNNLFYHPESKPIITDLIQKIQAWQKITEDEYTLQLSH